MCKILINVKEKALIHNKTGVIVRPTCFDTLMAHDSYLRGKKQCTEADELLLKVFKGEKVISKMIEESQKLNLIKKDKKVK
jgi:hypothetical protein